ncbi:hypothetical protein [Primorskyibacter sp. S87]|uniref:hypothetical protein n=1 Tax=Primorskyibacter sp. S87 TaxID=3415126 RepID=UPI003C7981DD
MAVSHVADAIPEDGYAEASIPVAVHLVGAIRAVARQWVGRPAGVAGCSEVFGREDRHRVAVLLATWMVGLHHLRAARPLASAEPGAARLVRAGCSGGSVSPPVAFVAVLTAAGVFWHRLDGLCWEKRNRRRDRHVALPLLPRQQGTGV